MKSILKNYLRKLSDWDCILVMLRVLHIHLRRYFETPAPVAFSLRTSVLVFVLLAIMPFHPMAIPTAIGAGISISLLFSSPRKI